MLIGEVAQRSGVTSRMLRHYDRIGLVSPTARTAGGYRDYSSTDLERLFRVEGLRTLGLSLTDIKDVLDTDSAPAPAELLDHLMARTHDRMARDRQLLERLQRLAGQSPTDWADAMHTVRLLRALDSDSAAVRLRAALTGDRHRVSQATWVRAFLDEDDVNVAGALAWAIGSTDDRPALDALAEGLRDHDVRRRRRAVRVIAGLTDADMADQLRAALHDTDETVRTDAALALAARGDGAVVPLLVDLVVTGRYDVEAADLLAALAERAGRTEQITHALGEALTSTDAEARCRIAQALIDLPGTAARDLLAGLIDDPDPAVAALASVTRQDGGDPLR